MGTENRTSNFFFKKKTDLLEIWTQDAISNNQLSQTYYLGAFK